MNEVTQVLDSIRRGESSAADRLLPRVYEELRRLAAQRLVGERPGQTLQPTALVHEAYVRLVSGTREQEWDGRGHFFAAAAEAMRRILIEKARRKRSQKRGGDRLRRQLDPAEIAAPEVAEDLLALNEALGRLAAVEPVVAELVKLRYFAGFTLTEAAETLGVSERTADSYWAYARAWLRAELEDCSPPA